MTGQQKFPWTSNGLTFRTRAHLENTIESFAGAGTKKHLAAAQTLLREAMNANRLSADQYTEIKDRLHL